MVAHGLPVMATLGAGTDLKPLPELLLQDIGPVCWLSRLRIDSGEQALVNGFLVSQVLARFAIEFPQDSRLAHGEKQLLSVEIHQNAFEHLIHIEGLTRCMLKMPLQPA